MMTSSNGNISALLAICAGNSPVTGEFPAQNQWNRKENNRIIGSDTGWPYIYHFETYVFILRPFRLGI